MPNFLNLTNNSAAGRRRSSKSSTKNWAIVSKWFLGLLGGFFSFFSPVMAGALTFTPPSSDSSVVYLENLFGVVDGVLHGTGSQIMGTIFGVFNAAVLALGGIVIMYTLIVGTLNTAAEGTMLGQKWNSIWIPVRSTIGLALLIPKASGYCLMQIFVMWVVVQGIGAGDKIWVAALSYLNRGGVIIHQQMNPATSKGADSGTIVSGAAAILEGEVCMSGLQTLLEAQRTYYLDQLNNKDSPSGPCYYTPDEPGIKDLCETAVPNFISTVDAVSFQSGLQDNIDKGKIKKNLSLPMPYIAIEEPYADLTGVCGAITWNALTKSDFSKVDTDLSSVSSQAISASELTRATAVQQMVVDLSPVANLMVGNDPLITSNTGDSTKFYSPNIAMQQYGVPYLSSATAICSSPSEDCTRWLPADINSPSGVLFNGTELLGAVTDYNAVMKPTLDLMNAAKSSNDAAKNREFIQYAASKGWLLAGSYFFDLIKLNGSATSKNGGTTDTDSGLKDSVFSPSNLKSGFTDYPAAGKCGGKFAALCNMFQGDPTAIKNLIGLFDASNDPDVADVGAPNFSATTKAISTKGSATAYGYLNNAYMIALPGQPGLAPVKFATGYIIDISMQDTNLSLHRQKYCFNSHFLGCLGRSMTEASFRNLQNPMFTMFQGMFNQVVNAVLMTFLSIPFTRMLDIFQSGVALINEYPGENPIVQLSLMGTSYINFAMEMWLNLIEAAIFSAIIPIFGIFIFALISLAMPLIVAWLGVMMTIGFLTAYYVPFLPYMTFTFGGISWLMVVIEAMVAAPIVAIGITHPEGDGALGKAEHGLMILLNVFLRPAMMITGYIAAIALCYVGVWILNEGYARVSAQLQPTCKVQADGTVNCSDAPLKYTFTDATDQKLANNDPARGYTNWAGLYGIFFSILMYTTIYMIIVQRSFELIYLLPDKVLRWIGGAPEETGQRTAQWAEESKSKLGEAGKGTADAGGQMGKQLTGYAKKGYGKLSGSEGADVTAE